MLTTIVTVVVISAAIGSIVLLASLALLTDELSDEEMYEGYQALKGGDES